jgi:hypothetical protein
MFTNFYAGVSNIIIIIIIIIIFVTLIGRLIFVRMLLLT